MTTTLIVWCAVIAVIILLTWFGFNRRAKANKADSQLFAITNLHACSISTARDLMPMSTEGVYEYSAVLSYRLQSWAAFFFAATATLVAILCLPFGWWYFLPAWIAAMTMLVSLIFSAHFLWREFLLDYSGRITEGGGIRPPITLTE
ncbi:MAG: hypothetical protein WC675_05085 [Patescibacteria group bacterium]|jgi:hypothetical protein